MASQNVSPTQLSLAPGAGVTRTVISRQAPSNPAHPCSPLSFHHQPHSLPTNHMGLIIVR